MKSVLLAAAFLASMSTAAFSKTIVDYSFATRSSEVGSAHTVKATISDQGQMTVSVMRLTAGGMNTQSIMQFNESLSQYNFETVKSLAKVLSNAKVTTTVRPFVCMTLIMPIPQGPQSLQIATGYDYQSDSFKGALRLVKTPSECYIKTVTAFVSQADVAKANRLESAIEVLAHDVLEANGVEHN